MTAHDPAFVARLQAYVRVLQSRMRLADWDVRVSAEPCNPDSSAEIETIIGRKVAILRVNADFPSEPPETQRHSLAHELVHAHLAHAHHLALGATAVMGKRAAKVFSHDFDMAIEYGVDGLADLIAPCLPTMGQALAE